MNEKNKDTKNLMPSNWIPFPRKIASDYKNGILSRKEYLLYCHARLQCNPYGIASVHLQSLRDDVFGSEGSKSTVSVNYVNQLLLSLKKKRFIYYEARSGRIGSFEVRFGDFKSPDDKYISIDHYFKDPIEEEPTSTASADKTEVTIEVEEEKQSLEELDNEAVKSNDLVDAKRKYRGYNNDTEHYPEIKNTDISVSYKGGNKGRENSEYECRNPTDSYKPHGHEEFVAHQIAREVGEKCMDRYLSLIRNGQFWILEKAIGELREDISSGKKIDDKPAYLNGIINRIQKEKIGK